MGCGSSAANLARAHAPKIQEVAGKVKTAVEGNTVKKVLVLRNAITGNASFSNKGIDISVAALKETYPEAVFVVRDLVDKQVPMLTEETTLAIRDGIVNTPAQKAIVKLADELIDELKSADLIIVGLPRYNFGVPTSFKTYLDAIARPRITFQYTAKGAEGLLPDVPVWIITSAGGVYGEDYYQEWLNTVLPFIGLKSLKYFYLEGSGMGKGDEALEKHKEGMGSAIRMLRATMAAKASKASLEAQKKEEDEKKAAEEKKKAAAQKK